MKSSGMRSFILLLFLFTGQLINAQGIDDFTGLPGYVSLKDSRSFKGQLSYDFKGDFIQVKVANRLYTFQAAQIKAFKVEEGGTARYFESLPVLRKNGYTRSQIFEVLYKGNASLYTRVYEVRATTPPEFNSRRGDITGYRMLGNRHGVSPAPQERPVGATQMTNLLVQNHDFFIKLRDQNFPIDLAERNYKRFKGAFGQHKTEIADFIKKENIDIKDPLHVVKVIEFYNEILTDL